MATRHADHTDLSAFLRAARDRLRPEEVGLPHAGRRRTPGLRRQEVAQLAAVSIDWYIRLEQGRVGTPGTGVLDSLASALRLSEPERRHLHQIARGAAPARRYRPAAVSPSLHIMLAGMPHLPAYVVDFRFDVLAHNAAAAALFGDDFGTGLADNIARLMFLSPQNRRMQLDWERIAREVVGNLRANFARQRDDARLRAVIAELLRRSADFSGWWNDQTVQERAHGTKRLRHPHAGDLAVCYDSLTVTGGHDQNLVVITPADETTERALRSLQAEPIPDSLGRIGV